MNELQTSASKLLVIHDDPQFPIDGRELHEQLEIGSKYVDWFKRMCEYGFVEDDDYKTCFSNLGSEMHGGQNKVNHMLTLSMAKELCMIQRTEMGRTIRRYLIEVENAWNTPEQVMARALRMADETIGKLRGQVLHLEAANSSLTVENQIMAPKAEYFDELVDRNLLTNFRETAKELGVKEKDFIRFLLDRKYIYRDKKGKLLPYADKNDGLFEVKECFNEKTQWRGTQTLITPKGRETFRLLYLKAA